jgi:hypothetical protein
LSWQREIRETAGSKEFRDLPECRVSKGTREKKETREVRESKDLLAK